MAVGIASCRSLSLRAGPTGAHCQRIKVPGRGNEKYSAIWLMMLSEVVSLRRTRGPDGPYHYCARATSRRVGHLQHTIHGSSRASRGPRCRTIPPGPRQHVARRSSSRGEQRRRIRRTCETLQLARDTRFAENASSRDSCERNECLRSSQMHLPHGEWSDALSDSPAP
jgi:hypothetical protein